MGYGDFGGARVLTSEIAEEFWVSHILRDTTDSLRNLIALFHELDSVASSLNICRCGGIPSQTASVVIVTSANLLGDEMSTGCSLVWTNVAIRKDSPGYTTSFAPPLNDTHSPSA